MKKHKMKFLAGDMVYYYGSGKEKGEVCGCRHNGISAGTDYGYSYQIKKADGTLTDWQHELSLSKAR